MTKSDRLHGALKDFYGYDSFRPQQQETIEQVLDGGDALVLMPTGGGKSLCYQLPAILSDGLTVVVSPLIALMHDQVTALQRAGANAQYLNSTLSPIETAQVERLVADGTVKLLYVAPERVKPDASRTPRSNAIRALIAIREAHCISEWARIPTRLSSPEATDRAIRRRAHRRLHCDSDSTGPARHRRAARSPEDADVHHQLHARQPDPADLAEAQVGRSPGTSIEGAA